MGPFPAVAVAAAVVVAVAAAVAVDVVAEVTADRIAMTGTVVGSTVVVEQAGVVSGSLHDLVGKTIESEVAARGWPDARVASVHMQLGTTSSGTVIDSVAPAFGAERLRYCYSGRS